MPSLISGQALVYYETFEAGPVWVTCRNGFSRTVSDLRAMAKTLQRAGFSVLLIENRGAGLTQSPPAFSRDDLRKDTLAVWKKLGIEKSWCLGISYGGVLSQFTACLHADRVHGMILISTTPDSKEIKFGRQLYAQDRAEIEQSLSHYFSPSFKEKNALLYQSLLKETAKVFMEPSSREKLKDQRLALLDFDSRNDLKKFSLPVLVAHGGADEVIPAKVTEIFKACLSNAVIRLFPNAGHLLLAECPRILYDEIVGFLTHHS